MFSHLLNIFSRYGKIFVGNIAAEAILVIFTKILSFSPKIKRK